jgi:ABC-2 type transport system permease protein
LIVLLSFSAFAGEREAGTLRQLASLGVPARVLALGKALGIASALLLIIVPASVVGAVVLAGAASADGSAGLARAALMALGYGLYLTAFLGLSLAVSALAHSSRLALIGLLGFWIVTGLAIPRAVADLSERLYPAPSATAMWAAMREDFAKGIDGHNPADARRQDLEKRVLAEYGVKTVEDLPVSFAGISLQAGEEYGNQVFDKHYSALWDVYERQDRVHMVGALMAPLLAVRSLSMAVAGTDFAQHRHFVTAAESYRRDLQRALNGEMTKNAKGLDFDYKADAAFWAQAPEFAYEPPAPALALLAAWAALAVGAAVGAAARLRVA